MWYLTINGHRDGTPYQSFSDALAAAKELEWKLVAVCIDIVYEKD